MRGKAFVFSFSFGVRWVSSPAVLSEAIVKSKQERGVHLHPPQVWCRNHHASTIILVRGGFDMSSAVASDYSTNEAG